MESGGWVGGFSFFKLRVWENLSEELTVELKLQWQKEANLKKILGWILLGQREQPYVEKTMSVIA